MGEVALLDAPVEPGDTRVYRLQQETYEYLTARLRHMHTKWGRTGIRTVDHVVEGEDCYVTTVEFGHHIGPSVIDEILKEVVSSAQRGVRAITQLHDQGHRAKPKSTEAPKDIGFNIIPDLKASKAKTQSTVIERSDDGKSAGVQVEHWSGRVDATATPRPVVIGTHVQEN